MAIFFFAVRTDMSGQHPKINNKSRQQALPTLGKGGREPGGANAVAQHPGPHRRCHRRDDTVAGESDAAARRAGLKLLCKRPSAPRTALRAPAHRLGPRMRYWEGTAPLFHTASASCTWGVGTGPGEGGRRAGWR